MIWGLQGWRIGRVGRIEIDWEYLDFWVTNLRFSSQKLSWERSWRSLGAQVGSKRHPDSAQRELKGPKVVPRRRKEPPTRCQAGPREPQGGSSGHSGGQFLMKFWWKWMWKWEDSGNGKHSKISEKPLFFSRFFGYERGSKSGKIDRNRLQKAENRIREATRG